MNALLSLRLKMLITAPDKRANRISPIRVETIGWFQDGAVDRH